MSQRSSLPRVPQVCIILESSHWASRARFQGILDYLRLYHTWCLHFVLGGPEGQRLPQPSYWRGDGFIARVPDTGLALKLASQKKPVVLLDPDAEVTLLLPQCSRVSLDNELVSQMAADYFLKMDHKRFAFVEPLLARNWAVTRRNSFMRILQNKHFSCEVFTPNRARATSWEKERRHLCDWLLSLPKPIAILAASDVEGREIIDACLFLRIGVPYEVAVLGIGNDEFLCNSCFPALSSIDICWEDGGFLAASLLDAKMKNRKTPQSILAYGPKRIVERRSTERVQLTDKFVVSVLEMIRVRDGLDIHVGTLARQLNVSRQWLQKKFKEQVGHSVIDEIQLRRMEKVKSLVAESDRTFNEIAAMCGFESGNHLRFLFKKMTGQTMTDFRNDYVRRTLPNHSSCMRGQ
ncbi:MAG: XylR family transcriptional regulator [Planctomycetia bacterium]|nr:XylR family transcriptional regulator [Planctomycetia bacterium]